MGLGQLPLTPVHRERERERVKVIIVIIVIIVPVTYRTYRAYFSMDLYFTNFSKIIWISQTNFSRILV